MKVIKNILITALALLAVGLLLVFIAFAASGFNVGAMLGKGNLDTDELTYSASEVNSIVVDTNITDVRITRGATEDGTIKVKTLTDKRTRHTVSVVSGGVLSVRADETPWYYHIVIFPTRTGIEITIPEEHELIRLDLDSDTSNINVSSLVAGESKINSDTGDVTIRSSKLASLVSELDTGDLEIYDSAFAEGVSVETDTGDVLLVNSNVAELLKIDGNTGAVKLAKCTLNSLNIDGDTGDVELEEVAVAQHIRIEADTGDVSLDGCTANELSVGVDTGDVELENTVTVSRINIETSTGEVDFVDCDAPDIKVITSTGDVELTLRSGKIFDADSNTGKVRVPSDTEGGRCYVRSSTGSIEINVR